MRTAVTHNTAWVRRSRVTIEPGGLAGLAASVGVSLAAEPSVHPEERFEPPGRHPERGPPFPPVPPVVTC